MTSCDLKIKFIFWGSKIVHWYSKTIQTCSMSQEEHTSRYIFALAPSEAKLSAKRLFGHFWVFDLTSEVIGWPRTSSLYINRFVSWRTTRAFFPRSSSSISGETARGVHTMNPHLCRERMRNGPSNSISRKYAQNLILLFESRCIRLRPQKKSEGYFGVYFYMSLWS